MEKALIKPNSLEIAIKETICRYISMHKWHIVKDICIDKGYDLSNYDERVNIEDMVTDIIGSYRP